MNDNVTGVGQRYCALNRIFQALTIGSVMDADGMPSSGTQASIANGERCREQRPPACSLFCQVC